MQGLAGGGGARRKAKRRESRSWVVTVVAGLTSSRETGKRGLDLTSRLQVQPQPDPTASPRATAPLQLGSDDLGTRPSLSVPAQTRHQTSLCLTALQMG